MKTLAFISLSLGAALNALAFSTSSYVQDGLVACWDGIENAGAGVHLSDTTVWKDIKGGREFVLTNATVGDDRITFEGNANSFGVLSAGDTVSTFVATKNGTMEIVYASRVAPSGYQVLLQSSANAGIAFGFTDSRSLLPHTSSGSSSPANSKYTFETGTATNSVSITYNNGMPVYVMANGAAAPSAGVDHWWNPVDETYIGVRANKSSFFPGSIYCIRLYNRKLTDAEIISNRSIDQLRFYGDSNSGLIISCNPTLMGNPSPGRGLVSGFLPGQTLEVSCGQTIVTNSEGNAEYRCVGWKLYDENDNVVSNGQESTFTYVHPTPAAYRKLEWQWEKHRNISNFSDYIQDGLIAFWDGIGNNGVNCHANNVTVWKDLIGGYAFSLYNVTVGTNCMVFHGTATSSLCDSYGVLSESDTESTFVAAANGTMEIVYRLNNGTSNQVLLQAPATSGIGFGNYKDGTQIIPYSGPSSSLKTLFGYTSGTIFNTFSVCYKASAPESAYVNTKKLSSGGIAAWSDPKTETYIGTRANRSSGFAFAGSIYCVRLYNRQLTEAEILTNQRIDLERFNAENSSESTLEISSTIEGVGSPDPQYGYIAELMPGDTRNLSCGDAYWTDQTTSDKYSCVGWKLYDIDGNLVRSGRGRTLSYTHPTPKAYRRLVWQWKSGLNYGSAIYIK